MIPALLIAFSGFYLGILAPTNHRTGISCSATGPPLAATTRLLIRGHIGPDLFRGQDYDLGTCAPGDTVRRLISAPVGPALWFASTSADSGRTWSCWSSDSVNVEELQVPGDLNGDGLVNIVDLSVWAGLQLHASMPSFPK